MALNCTLCKIEFKNDEQLKQHLEGKRHKKLESIKEERESSAKRSLFLSGLKKDTFIKQLEDHFIQFGKISKVVTDHEKNAYAIVEFEDEKSVDAALSTKEHKVNGKTLKVNRRELKEFVSKIANNGEKKKELLEKLKEEALAVNTILAKCNSFDDQIDKLIDYFKINEEQMKQRELICQTLNQTFTQFWSQDEFKVCIFGSTYNGLACNGSDMDLTLLFNQYLTENQHKQLKLPKITVKQLKQNENNHSGGQDSSDSNMAEAVETEMDEDIDLDGENNNEEERTLKESIVKFFNDKDYKEFLKFEVEHQIKIIARIIQRFVFDIKSLKTITNTRCPVVRFHHDKANIYCDLTLNNFLANENSKLVKLYLDLEPNLKKIIYIIRYWFKQKNLYSSSKFNSYTIIWLIIFYMQKKNIGYLPTVDYLSKITNKINEIHGWNCSFEDDLTKIRSMKPENSQSSSQIDINSLNDLLKGFFEFYSTFSFASDEQSYNIISTRNSQVVHKTELSKLSPFINVQDPFDLSHNLTVNISKNALEKFISECKGSNDLLQYAAAPRKSVNKGWGLILLMTKKSLPILAQTPANKELIEKSMLTLKLVDHEADNYSNEEISVRKAIDFVMFLLNDCLLFEKLDGDKLITKRKKRLRILNQICDQVDSLGLNCSPKRLKTAQNTSSDPSKPSNTYVCVIDESLNNNGDGEDDEEKEDDKNKVVASYQLCAKGNTWMGRRAVKRDLKQKSDKLNELDLEKQTSQKIASSNTELAKSINFRIQFSYSQESIENKENSTGSKKNLSHLQIKFDLLDEVNGQNDLIDFTTLVHFLDVYINNCQEKLFSQWDQSRSNLAAN